VNNHDPVRSSVVEKEMASQQSQLEELHAQIRWSDDERDRNSWLLEAVPVGYVLMDEHGNVKEVNRQFEKMVGQRAKTLVEGPLARLVFQADVAAFREHLRHCKQSSEVVTTQLRLRNGKVEGLPVEIVSFPSRRDRNGLSLYRTAIIDVTKHRATEQKLADALQSFETLLDTVEGVVCELDGATLKVTFVSRYAEKMLGYPLSQWFESGFWERHIYVDDREQVMQEISRALKQRTTITVDYRVLTADRQLLWIHDRIGVRSQGGKVKLLGIAVDVTPQKKIEEELEKERANLELRIAERTSQLQTTISELEAFSYSLSHDMRAPLRAMEGYTQLLQNILADKLGPKEIDFFGRIMASAERLDNLIQDVLQYSRVARAPLELKEIDLEKIVNQVISDYPHLQPPGADIRMQKPLMQALGHEAFLTQCISNLLSNAVKFVAPGVKPNVTVYTRPYGRDMRLFVEDNGIGIPADNQKQIFGIFQRLHPHTAYPGTGIGLAIVQKAVQRMGGQVGVESTLGKGSTFWLQLKRAA
jgi:PAS domain S-box-containing protein